MDETYGTYVDDECCDIHDHDDDTEHDTDDDSGDDTDDDTNDDTDNDTGDDTDDDIYIYCEGFALVPPRQFIRTSGRFSKALGSQAGFPRTSSWKILPNIYIKKTQNRTKIQ